MLIVNHYNLNVKTIFLSGNLRRLSTCSNLKGLLKVKEIYSPPRNHYMA